MSEERICHFQGCNRDADRVCEGAAQLEITEKEAFLQSRKVKIARERESAVELPEAEVEDSGECHPGDIGHQQQGGGMADLPERRDRNDYRQPEGDDVDESVEGRTEAEEEE